MKFFAVFAAVMALTAAMPTQSEWSLHEITAALQDPSTNPIFIPYLEHALNQIIDALHAGLQIDTVAIPLPAEIISPAPVIVEEAAPVEAAPVVVAPVESAPAAAASSPLVQIIVNVNQQEQAAIVPAPAAVPEINPTPVVVVDEDAAPINPTPVVVVDEDAAPINPTPVVVVDEVAEPIVPTPVIIVDEVAEEIVNPPTIEVNPAPAEVVELEEVNPIDVIAVGAPEENPIDIMNPIPVNPASEAGSIWV